MNRTPLLIIGMVLVIAVIGGAVYYNSSKASPAANINKPANTAPPAAKPRSRICARTNRAAPSVPSWRVGVAIRSTRRRSIRGFRPGRASPAVSATGSDRASPRSGAGASARHVQIAAQYQQQGQHHDDADHGGDDRKQFVGFQPSSQRPDHYLATRS